MQSFAGGPWAAHAVEWVCYGLTMLAAVCSWLLTARH